MNRAVQVSTILITKRGDIWVQTFGTRIYRLENCRVLSTSVTTTSAGGANYTTNYKYDAKGYISSESTDLGGLLEIKFTRDDKGKLISFDSYYIGDFVSKEKFNYTQWANYQSGNF